MKVTLFRGAGQGRVWQAAVTVATIRQKQAMVKTMSFIRIIPRYKLLLHYDVRPEVYAVYQRYILEEFVPGMQEMKLYMTGAWRTVYGNYPDRQIEFVLEDLNTMRAALRDARWQGLEDRLKSYTTGYERKLVLFRQGFQF